MEEIIAKSTIHLSLQLFPFYNIYLGLRLDENIRFTQPNPVNWIKAWSMNMYFFQIFFS